jgi:hypothetical protein
MPGNADEVEAKPDRGRWIPHADLPIFTPRLTPRAAVEVA